MKTGKDLDQIEVLATFALIAYSITMAGGGR
jgi:hypothetical protein